VHRQFHHYLASTGEEDEDNGALEFVWEPGAPGDKEGARFVARFGGGSQGEGRTEAMVTDSR
jgi:hypothetical protein